MSEPDHANRSEHSTTFLVMQEEFINSDEEKEPEVNIRTIMATTNPTEEELTALSAIIKQIRNISGTE